MVDTPPFAWKLFGDVSPTALADTSLELHWAVQLIGAVPLALLPPEADASHANLGWQDGAATFVTRPVGGAHPARFGLRVPDFSLVVLDAPGVSWRRPFLPPVGSPARDALRFSPTFTG